MQDTIFHVSIVFRETTGQYGQVPRQAFIFFLLQHFHAISRVPRKGKALVCVTDLCKSELNVVYMPIVSMSVNFKIVPFLKNT